MEEEGKALQVVALMSCGLLLSMVIGQWLVWLVQRWRGKAPPGPIPLPLVGNLLHLFASPFPHRSLAALARRYGPLVYLRLGSFPTVIVSSPAAARCIFHTHDKAFAGRPPTSAFKLLYGGDQACFTSPFGPNLHFTRKLYTRHLLNFRHLKELHFPVIADEIHRLIRNLHIPADAGSPVNVTACLSTLTENILFRVVLGQRMPDIDSTTHSLRELGELLRDGAFHLGAKFVGDAIPALGFLDYYTRRSTTRWFSSIDTILEAIVSQRVHERIGKPASGESSQWQDDAPRDILDAFLATSDPPLSNVKMKAMILELLLAGTDSVGMSLDWAMAEILSNARVLGNVQEEVDNAVGKERMVGMDDLPSLPYVKAVVRETLRKHPPGPLLLPRESLEACELAIGGNGLYEIPEGARVLVNAWAIANDPMTWAEPERFVPERFIMVVGGKGKAVVDVYGQHCEMVPFGGGRRICQGIGLALAILELTLASLVHCFDWVVHDVVDMREKVGLGVPRQAPLFASPTKFRLTSSLAP